MLKFATAQVLSAVLAPAGMSRHARRTFAHRHHFDYEVRPGFLYVRSRAISSRCNDNFDEFPAEELEKSYRTFLGKPVFVNHNNENHKRARGVVIDAVLHKDSNRDGSKDWWVELLHEVDAVRFPRLAQEILKKNIARTSMGCDVAYSVCSACGNKATSPAEYCEHIPAAKGQRLYRRTASGSHEGILIRETCYGLKFFENSLLVEPPADPTAVVIGDLVLGPGTKFSSLDMPPRTALNDTSNDGIGHSVLQAQGSVGNRSTASVALPLGEKVGYRADLPHGLIGEFGSRIDDSLQASQPLHHVGGVLGVGAQDPMVRVVAQRSVASVSNHFAGRDGADQRFVAPSVGAHTAAFGVVQGQPSVSVLEGVADPGPALLGVAREGDLGQVARKNAGKGPHVVNTTASKDPRFAEVGMGEDEDGHYVKTHRARSDSYETPEAIPQSEVDRIAATGTLTSIFAAISRKPGEGQQELFDSAPLHVDKLEPSKVGTWSAKDAPIDYDEIGRRWPQQYGDPEIHGEDANPDGAAIGDAASHLAHATPSDPEGENHHVSELQFHSERVHPSKIDYARHGRYDGRVSRAREGYRDHPNDVPPLVLVHRHGVYQVADGHHRGEGAHLEGKTVRAYVAHSPFPHEPSGDGEMAPYHGAEQSPGRTATLTELMRMEAAGRLPSNPADHPWFQTAGLSHHNVIAHWDQATPEEKAQGARWYPDAHHVAKAIAKLDPSIKTDKEAAHKGAGVLSAYSPQQGWWANQHNAARSFVQGKAVGKGEGIMVMGSHANAAQRIMNGEDHQDVLKGPKTQDFAHLIEHGGNDENGQPSKRVVMDRHALSVAAGRRLSAEDTKGFPSSSRKHYEHAAETYRTAAAVLSDREKRTIPPHEVQAVTWLTRQRLNAEGDTSGAQKGRNTVQRNQREQWKGLTHEHTPELHETEPPNSHVSRKEAVPPFSRGPASGKSPGDPVTHIAVDKPYGDVRYADPGMRGDKARYPIDTDEHIRAAEDYIHHEENERKYSPGDLHHVEDAIDEAAKEHGIGDHKGSRRTAYGETKAPQDVDTLREDSCPVCGDRDTYDGTTCSVCGYVAPPSIFQDPDLGVARQMDLRKNVEQFNGQPGMPVDPDQLGPDGQPLDPQQQDAGMEDQTGQPQPGGLPGEVQAEVQPGGEGTPMDQNGVGGGIPDSDGMVPQGPGGAPMNPDQLGPDGQPVPQMPGQQGAPPNMVLGPDGQPIGPQPLPAAAISGDGQPFNPGPNMPQGPGGPEGPVSPDELGPDGMEPTGQQPDPTRGGMAPGTPGDGVPDLSCPACGFTADSTPATSVDMDTSLIPPDNTASPDGVQAGDVCPNCGQGLLVSPGEVTGNNMPPEPGTAVPGA